MIEWLANIRPAIEKVKGFDNLTSKTDIPFELMALHPRVIEVAGNLFRDGYYRQAILDTYISLVQEVRIKSGKRDLDGTA